MASAEQLKTENVQHIRRLFYERREPWTRPDLAKAAGLSMGGTTNVLRVLMERKEVLYLGDSPSTGGRKSKLYGLNPDWAHVGVMMLTHRGDNFSIREIGRNLKGETVYIRRMEMANVNSAKAVTDAACDLAHYDAGLKCLVVSFPGIVAEDGTAVSSDFPGLAGMNMGKRLKESLYRPVRIENDVNLAAVAYGRLHPECENLAVLYQPKHDPAGVGLLVHGRLLRGREGVAGEIGRIEREDQMALLASDPKRLVRLQIDIINCLLAPDRIAWSCPVLADDVDFSAENAVPEAAAPVLERYENWEELSIQGAEILGREMLLKA